MQIGSFAQSNMDLNKIQMLGRDQLTRLLYGKAFATAALSCLIRIIENEFMV